MGKKRKLPHGSSTLDLRKSLDLTNYLNGKERPSAPRPTAQTPDPQVSPSPNSRQNLPLRSYQDEIRKILLASDVLIIVGETGSGKSTQVPQFLYDEDWCRQRTVRGKKGAEEVKIGGTIAITQPRRVAATTLAHRVAREMGTPLGQGGRTRGLVGYSVRFDHNVPRGARIKFLTEGMLLQELLRDPQLRQYSAVIVDEIHERSVDVDVLSGFLKQILTSDLSERGGMPLKIIIMSATANVERIQEFFRIANTTTVPVLRVEGRQFPVDVIHTSKPVPDLNNALGSLVLRINQQEALPGDILAFLTGQEEIEAVQKHLEHDASALPAEVPRIKVLPLFGQLSIEAQHDAFKPVQEKFTRKVVLATNIAETSVTVPGVRFVIDTGKAKVKQFRMKLGMESLLVKPISKSSAIQRSGRAGREAPGSCYRLYTQEGYESLADEELPEILRIDILGAILAMKARGVDDISTFPLMDAPDQESIGRALMQLNLLEALDDNGRISDLGRKMALFPLSAPLARVLLAAAEPQSDCLLDVIDIISCITSGEDIFHQLRSEEVKEEVEAYRQELYRREGDLLTYLTTIQRFVAENADRTKWCYQRRLNLRNMRQAMHVRRQLRGICQKENLLIDAPPKDPQPFTPASPSHAETLLKCFLKGFVLRTAMLAPDSSYITTHGKHVVTIHPSSVLHGQKKEAIMFLDHVYTQKSYAKKVSAVQGLWIAEALETI
jgi:ATP-dependent RNA helicase DHR2